MSYEIRVYPDGSVWHEDDWHELAEDRGDDYYVLAFPDEMKCPDDECELPMHLQMNNRMVEMFISA